MQGAIDLALAVHLSSLGSEPIHGRAARLVIPGVAADGLHAPLIGHGLGTEGEAIQLVEPWEVPGRRRHLPGFTSARPLSSRRQRMPA